MEPLYALEFMFYFQACTSKMITEFLIAIGNIFILKPLSSKAKLTMTAIAAPYMTGSL